MKMGILCSGLLWGSFFILLGVAVILKHTLHLDIPVVRLFFGFLLIYLGIQVLTSGARHRGAASCDAIFTDRDFTAGSGKGEYNVIFGKGTVDLTDLEPGAGPIKVNAIFGSGVLKLDKGTPARVKATSAFGAVRLPDGSSAVFGDAEYRTKSFKEGKPHLIVEAVAVFGHCEVVEE